MLLHALLLLMLSPIWPLGDFHTQHDPFVVVNKKTNELAWIENGEIRKTFRVATGKWGNLTPEGLFTITVKAENPFFRRGNIPGGDNRNPLGTRWIGFDARNTDGRIYGLHGTNQPSSIGKHVTSGCVRLQKKDVEFLYSHLPVGAKVWIVSSELSFQHIISLKMKQSEKEQSFPHIRK